MRRLLVKAAAVSSLALTSIACVPSSNDTSSATKAVKVTSAEINDFNQERLAQLNQVVLEKLAADSSDLRVKLAEFEGQGYNVAYSGVIFGDNKQYTITLTKIEEQQEGDFTVPVGKSQTIRVELVNPVVINYEADGNVIIPDTDEYQILENENGINMTVAENEVVSV